jgi:hypothetical protein
MNEPGLEFVWVGDDAIDPLEQAQTLQILVGAGIKTREEARADLGLAPTGGKEPAAGVTGPLVAKRGATRTLLGKLNPHHDEHGQFATADGAVATVGSPARKPQPTGVQVASNDAVRSDVAPAPGVEAPPPSPASPEAVPSGQGEPASLGSGTSDGETLQRAREHRPSPTPRDRKNAMKNAWRRPKACGHRPAGIVPQVCEGMPRTRRRRLLTAIGLQNSRGKDDGQGRFQSASHAR